MLFLSYRRTEEHGKSGTLPSPERRKKKTKEDKPLTLPEQRLAAALDDDTSSSRSPSPPPPPTHTEEQAALRAETIAAFHTSTGDIEKREEEEGGLFTLREKTKDEIEREEAEYRAYLEREVGPLEEILDLGEEGKTEGEVRRQEDDDTHARPAEAETGKKKKKKKGRKSGGEDRKETDQEFLIKCVCRFSSCAQRMIVYFLS